MCGTLVQIICVLIRFFIYCNDVFFSHQFLFLKQIPGISVVKSVSLHQISSKSLKCLLSVQTECDLCSKWVLKTYFNVGFHFSRLQKKRKVRLVFV